MLFENRPKIGTEVIFDAKVVRESYGSDFRHRRWIVQKLDKQRHGYYIGYRYKQNGELIFHSEWSLLNFDSYKPSVEFRLDETMPTTRVALVIPNERSDPIFVPFDRMEVANKYKTASKADLISRGLED